MKYMFNVADSGPIYQRISTQPSVASPGKTIVYRNGIAMVVEPTGKIRDLRLGESADSPWCWATLLGDMLVYDSDGGPTVNPTIVMFKLVA